VAEVAKLQEERIVEVAKLQAEVSKLAEEHKANIACANEVELDFKRNLLLTAHPVPCLDASLLETPIAAKGGP
jgi:hypothetical protein